MDYSVFKSENLPLYCFVIVLPIKKLENKYPNCSTISGISSEFLKWKLMLCSTNAINPKLQNTSAAAVLMLQNALDMKQFQHFQEAPALDSLFTCMLEKRSRFLNAQPHIQGRSQCCSSSLSSHWPCWRNLEATTTCVYLPSFSWPGNLSPYPTGHPVYELCV